MTKTYACPKCGRDVPLDKINVAKDIMLCPSCGETSCFSDVVGEIDERRHEDDLRGRLNAAPPEHLKVEHDPTDMTGRIVMIYRKVSLTVLFLIPFTAVWSGFSMTGIYGSQLMKHHFDPKLSLFGLPFLIGTIVLVSLCLFMLFGKRVLTLERGKGSYFFGVGPFGVRRRFSFNRRSRIDRGETSYRVGGGRHGGGHPLSELHLSNPDDSNTIHLCAGMSEDALDYVEAVFRREVSRV